MADDEEEFDDVLSEEEERRAALLSAGAIREIDAEILALAHLRWRKVALLVGQMVLKNREVPGGELVPMAYYVRRIAHLVKQGQLESQGNLRRMRYGEVRLPATLS